MNELLNSEIRREDHVCRKYTVFSYLLLMVQAEDGTYTSNLKVQCVEFSDI